MKGKKIKAGRTFVLRLEHGDEILREIAEFCDRNSIKSGYFTGIGALKKARIYSVQTVDGKFISEEEKIEKPIELISADGNLTRDENGKALVHIHVCLGLPDHSATTGHLLEGIVSWTGDFFIQETEEIKKRKMGELMLMEL